jgi:hypothetical protein
MQKTKSIKISRTIDIIRRVAALLLAAALVILGSVSAFAAPSAAQTAAKPSAAIARFTAEKSGFENIKAYAAVNSDVKGWIKIPGTNIDYPVLHDNRVFIGSAVPHYYLDKTFTNNKAEMLSFMPPLPRPSGNRQTYRATRCCSATIGPMFRPIRGLVRQMM